MVKLFGIVWSSLLSGSYRGIYDSTLIINTVNKNWYFIFYIILNLLIIKISEFIFKS
jgi:hypothetical protein